MQKQKKLYRVLNYFKSFLVFVSTTIGDVLISIFLSLVAVLVGIASSAVGLEIYAITTKI